MNDKTTGISLEYLLKRFRLKIACTFFLVVLDATIFLLFPLFLGFAINDLLIGEYTSLIYFALLGLASLVIGAGRRFFDTRIYASIYETISSEFVESERQKDSPVSKTSARVGLLNELVEFLEESFPLLVMNLVGLFGTLVILYYLNLAIFAGCLVVMVVIIVVYSLTTRKTINFNKNYNDVLEEQVDRIADKKYRIRPHFRSLMKWSIGLSDLETINFSIIWFFMILLLLFSLVSTVDAGIVEYGTIFSILLYVFDYMENSMNLPLYYQQLIRLKEISDRISE